MSSAPSPRVPPKGEESHSGVFPADSVIVLHPGSRYLRLGRASDPFPVQALHCLARKRRRESQGRHAESFIVKKAVLSAEDDQSLSECRTQLAHSLQNSLQSNGKKRFGVPRKHLCHLNADLKPTLQSPSGEGWLDEPGDTVFCEDVLRLGPKEVESYNIHFPYHKGDLNIHSGVGGSRTAALADLEALWTFAVERLLGIDRGLFPKLKAVLIIPALYDRPLIKHLVSLLLVEMGFGGCFVLQDHVAATFGAGLGYACVVDVGDQKTSISCVEDGISQVESRVHLDYGGGDISQVFLHFVRDASFPTITDFCPESVGVDAESLQRFKEESCHLDLDQCGMSQKQFVLRRPGDDGKLTSFTYETYLADDALLAPSALFHPVLFKLTEGSKRLRVMGIDRGDPEDPHDHIYLSETSRKYTKAGTIGDTSEQADPQNIEEDVDIVADSDQVGSSQTRSSRVPRQSPSFELISLDQAVVKSIESCPNEDMRRKMYSCILVVGGGARFRGLQQYLRGKLALQIPFAYRSDPMEIILDAKDMSAATTSWRGAAVLACLETAQELWIAPEEWRKYGQKMLRERAPFPWA